MVVLLGNQPPSRRVNQRFRLVNLLASLLDNLRDSPLASLRKSRRVNRADSPLVSQQADPPLSRLRNRVDNRLRSQLEDQVANPLANLVGNLQGNPVGNHLDSPPGSRAVSRPVSRLSLRRRDLVVDRSSRPSSRQRTPKTPSGLCPRQWRPRICSWVQFGRRWINVYSGGTWIVSSTRLVLLPRQRIAVLLGLRKLLQVRGCAT